MNANNVVITLIFHSKIKNNNNSEHLQINLKISVNQLPVSIPKRSWDL